jgi:anti-sigma regulatory factor (Ser/Thr protein kinase)
VAESEQQEGPPGPAPTLGDPRDSGGDAILGAALEGLRRAAEEVEVERSVAETLQRSLLREKLPDVAGLRIAAHYEPGSTEARIGGDWYDAVPLRDGRVAMVIGDVVGRGIKAAARMAHLQSAVRAYALEGLRPALILERMNSFVYELDESGTATLLIAVIDPESETTTLASAGHPPPLIVPPEGESVFAEGPPGTPLGAFGLPTYEESVVSTPAGSTMIMYTDGLVERSDQTLDAGLARLRSAALTMPRDPDDGCHHLLDDLVGDGAPRDDVALIVTHLLQPEPTLDLSIPAEPRSLAGVRRELARWLGSQGASDALSFELLVATGEAAANAVAHAYPPGEAQFAVRARRDGGQVVVEITDYGQWRAPRHGSVGRGLILMEELTDGLEIEKGALGTTVRLRKGIPQGATG